MALGGMDMHQLRRGHEIQGGGGGMKGRGIRAGGLSSLKAAE